MARCQAAGGQLGAATFGSQGERDAWLVGAPNCPSGCIVAGPTWVVVAETAALTRIVQSRVGGRIV